MSEEAGEIRIGTMRRSNISEEMEGSWRNEVAMETTLERCR